MANTHRGGSSEDNEQQNNENTLISLFKAGTLKIGDTVEYNPIAKGDTGNEAKYHCHVDEATTGDPNDAGNYSADYYTSTSVEWKILGTSGTGNNEHIIIISSGQLPCNKTWYMWRSKFCCKWIRRT